MKKIFDFCAIGFIMIVSVAFRSLFLYLGWDILSGIVTFTNLPDISYLEWFGLLAFLYIFSGAHFGNNKTYSIDDITHSPDFMLKFLSGTINKLFALVILAIISLIV